MEALITKFYSAFAKLDYETMISCYHDDVEFIDPAFGELKGNDAKTMWEMLCLSQQGKDFKIEFSNIWFNNNKGGASWEAFYTFSKTGRRIHNEIEAKFDFKDGLIIHHMDNFNLHKWAKQALGFKGLLLGKTHFFKRSLQTQTNSLLYQFKKQKKAN